MHASRFRARFARSLAVALAVLALVGSAPAARASGTETPRAQSAPSAPVDLNKASQDELTALPGIGPEMARRIVEFREQNGPFKRVEDLLKVKGIGEKSFQKLRPHVKVS
jgi:competence protein ComEA